MSKAVTFEQVRTGLANFGTLATLITVGAEGRPHVVSSLVAVDGERLVVDVGGGTRANLEQRPVVTLVWQPHGDGQYQLILDGSVASIGERNEHGVSTVHIDIDSAIQHRVAGAPGEASSCQPIDAS